MFLRTPYVGVLVLMLAALTVACQAAAPVIPTVTVSETAKPTVTPLISAAPSGSPVTTPPVVSSEGPQVTARPSASVTPDALLTTILEEAGKMRASSGVAPLIVNPTAAKSVLAKLAVKGLNVPTSQGSGPPDYPQPESPTIVEGESWYSLGVLLPNQVLAVPEGFAKAFLSHLPPLTDPATSKISVAAALTSPTSVYLVLLFR